MWKIPCHCIWWNLDKSSSSPPPILTCVGLMFAHRLLAVPGVWGAVGCEALSVTSCSILFLCCCASALRPPGLTLHCSSNNCCGTPNICKPPLPLTQPPLHWAHGLCAAAVCACVRTSAQCVQAYFWRWSYLVQVVSHCVRAQHVVATGTFKCVTRLREQN